MKPVFFLFTFLLFSCLEAKDKDFDDISKIEIELSADCEPITTIADCVNIISGRFFQVDSDFRGSTIDPLRLNRHYDSGSHCETFLGLGFGSQFPLFASEIQKGARHSHAMIHERDGFLIPYQGSLNGIGPDKRKTCQMDPRIIKNGYTNLSRSKISGCANFINWEAVYRSKPKPKQGFWEVSLGDGSRRIYGKEFKFDTKTRRQIVFPTKTTYLLTEEFKPNGNCLRFNYEFKNGRPLLSKIETVNRIGNQVLNSVKINYSPNECLLISSCGHQVRYIQNIQSIYYPILEGAMDRTILNNTVSTQHGLTSYKTTSGPNPKVYRVEKPNGRFLEVKYNGKKVKSLEEPLGTEGEVVTTFRFEYFDKSTLVQDALGQSTVYTIDKNQRLSLINALDKNNNSIRQEVFEWSSIKDQEGWLKTKSIRLGNQICYLRSYDYDSCGNVVRETVYGNLTGNKQQTFTIENKEGIDQYAIEFEYSKDGRNQLLRKKTPEGLIITYSYLPETNLCTKELQSYSGMIQERIFKFYDDNGQTTKIIEDDGSSEEATDLSNVTYRRVQEFFAVDNANQPSFGKPKQLMETYLNRVTGQMIPLKKINYSYDAKGNEVCQKVYNAKDAFCFETTKIYDDHQRLIQETNPLGQSTHYRYDENNNKIEEECIGSGQLTRYYYDFGNRLVRKEEIHEEGMIFETTYAYNALNQLIAEIDNYGNQTSYKYDRLGREIECVMPAIMDVSGNSITPTIKKEYNVLNQMISKIDENGNTTDYLYNIYGKPTQIKYPDGSVEGLSYYPCGWIKQKTNIDGTAISYLYDPKGRVLKETFLDTNGLILKTEKYYYKGPLLTFKKDAMGIITSYEYDGAGRKISETTEDQIYQFEYDDFDRITHVFRPSCNGEGQHEVYQYDELDRVILKIRQDGQGQIYAKEEYEYDIHGNQIQKTIWHDDKRSAVYHWLYNSDRSLDWQKDPLDSKTSWLYNHEHLNELNQKVQLRTCFDPMKRKSIEIDDAFHRCTQKILYHNGQVFSSLRDTYDAKGNKIQTKALVLVDGTEQGEYIIQWKYNSRGWVESETELPAGKTTQFIYDGMGRLTKKIKPDGVSLSYEHDSLGRMIAVKSSDGSIFYTYQYNLHDRPIEICDHVYELTQRRHYDNLDRIVQEQLSSDVVIHYEYDPLDRLKKLSLPDGSSVCYTYDAFNLKKIQRFNQQGVEQYAYECLKYDWCGKLLKGKSPVCVIDQTYDLLGRPTAIESPLWKTSLNKFDPLGNLLASSLKDPDGKKENKFTYDRFNFLSSEKGAYQNQYSYDSIGNCVKKNSQSHSVNNLNQILKNGKGQFSYDLNGNLIKQTDPSASYKYDALNRLINCCLKEKIISLIYDSFGRCIQIRENSEIKSLLYLDDQEIGSILNGKLHELRLIHPKISRDKTYAIELQGEVFYPIQDHCHNISALQKSNGTLAEWYNYSAFGEQVNSDKMKQVNPWRFANRRFIGGLSLFTHRLYNSHLMRWQTTDPIGFKDGINLYTYVHNNPYYYRDLDGKFAFVIPIAIGVFGSGGITISAASMGAILGAVSGAVLGWVVYEASNIASNSINQVENDEDEKTHSSKKPQKRTEPRNLGEQLTLEEAKAKPRRDDDEIMNGKIKDSRYPADEWKKGEHVHDHGDGTKTDIHYWENRKTGERTDFKFKDY